MEPRIRYARTSDGVRIAFWELGEGPALVCMPATPFTHCQLEWEIEDSRRWLQALMAGHHFVRYDSRGFGLSDRNVDDFTLEANCRDLDAVADALGLDKFALYATADSAMSAIVYAATRPERVTHLVLWCAWARRTDVSTDARTRTLRSLVDEDWHIYTETAARVLLGWDQEEAAGRFAAFYREAADPDTVKRAMPAVYASDASPYLPQIKCPTLVIHRRQLPAGYGVEVAREIAASIPDSRLVLMEGVSPLPFGPDMEEIAATIHDFLGDKPAARTAPPGASTAITPAHEALPAGPVTILFTDIEGSTRLTQLLGDERAQQVIRLHNDIVRKALAAHAGREIKHTGDGIMASFPAASAALQCAIDIQRDISQRGALPTEGQMRVRIGVNSGEPVAEGGDYFGTSVQLAARICEIAEAGQILVAGVVRDLAAGKGFAFNDRGESTPRGFADPVRLYEVTWG